MKKSHMNLVTSGVKVGAGFIVGRMAAQKVTFLQTNPYFSAVGQVVLAAVLSGMGKTGKEVALGVAASGIIDGVKAVAPGMSAQLGINGVGYLPPVGSTSVHSVAGLGNRYGGHSMPGIKVE